MLLRIPQYLFDFRPYTVSSEDDTSDLLACLDAINAALPPEMSLKFPTSAVQSFLIEIAHQLISI